MSRRLEHVGYTAKSSLGLDAAAAVRLPEVRPRAGTPRLGSGEGQGYEEVSHVLGHGSGSQTLYGNRTCLLRRLRTAHLRVQSLWTYGDGKNC